MSSHVFIRGYSFKFQSTIERDRVLESLEPVLQTDFDRTMDYHYLDGDYKQQWQYHVDVDGNEGLVYMLDTYKEDDGIEHMNHLSFKQLHEFIANNWIGYRINDIHYFHSVYYNGIDMPSVFN